MGFGPKMKLEIEKLNENVPTPKYATSGSAAFDLTNQSGKTIQIHPGETVIIPTGIKVKLPSGTAGFISSRSGKSLQGFRVANAPGIVDEDYRNEVGVIAANDKDGIVTVEPGERIAQFTVLPVIRCDIAVVESIDIEENNERGLGGFGSSGSH